MNSIGIDDMSFYLPPLSCAVDELVEKRKHEFPDLVNKLEMAIHTTGQKLFRLPKKWQDSLCLSAESVFSLLKHFPFIDKIRYLISATESSIDNSKPIAAFIQGLLREVNVYLNDSLLTYQTQHACAAGAISILQAAAMIGYSNNDEYAVVSTTDIARYKRGSTAEITQGSGAVSMLISKNPRLLKLDLGNLGYFSDDVDDFFKPMYAKSAMVRGRYSMNCYQKAVSFSLNDYCKKLGASLKEVFDDTDYLVLHAPFKNMPSMALKHLLKRELGFDKDSQEQFLLDKRIPEATDIISHIGNTYTAATFFSLGDLLQKEYARINDELIGKKVLILSYGSGNTSLVMNGEVMPQASKIISSWNLNEQLSAHSPIAFDQYEQWLGGECGDNPLLREFEGQQPDKNSFYLKSIREDGYRIYDIAT